MKRVFVDATFYIAQLNPRDDLHDTARIAYEALGDVEYTTSAGVLTEVLNYCAKRGQHLRELAAALAEAVTANATISLQHPSMALFGEAIALYRKRRDKGYSLTDCEAMCIMERECITEILTSDHHFEQEGYTVLLK